MAVSRPRRYPTKPSPFCIHWRGVHSGTCKLGIRMDGVRYFRGPHGSWIYLCDREQKTIPWDCPFALWEDEVDPPVKKAKWEE